MGVFLDRTLKVLRREEAAVSAVSSVPPFSRVCVVLLFDALITGFASRISCRWSSYVEEALDPFRRYVLVNNGAHWGRS